MISALALLLNAPIELPQADINTARALFRRGPDPNTGESTAARVRLKIDDKGRVVDCELLASVGTEKIAVELCEKSIGVRFKPATDEADSKIYASYVTVLSAFPDGEEGNRESLYKQLNKISHPADLVLMLAQMPADIESPKRVLVKGRIDTSGKMVVCETINEPSEQFAAVACDQANQHTFATIRSEAGELVTHVRSVSVEFTITE